MNVRNGSRIVTNIDDGFVAPGDLDLELVDMLTDEHLGELF
jgi:hypothetical protein